MKTQSFSFVPSHLLRIRGLGNCRPALAEADANVLRGQLRLTRSLLPMGLLSNVAMALILSLAFTTSSNRNLQLGWAACCLLVNGLRFADNRLNRPGPDPERLVRLRCRIQFGAAVQGILWGLAGTAILPPEPLQQVLLLSVVVGTCAGSVLILCPVWPTHLLLVVPATVPLCCRLLGSDLLTLRLAGGLGLFYVGAMLLLGSRLSRWLEGILREAQESEARAALQQSVNLALLRDRERAEDALAEQSLKLREAGAPAQGAGKNRADGSASHPEAAADGRIQHPQYPGT